MKLLLSLVNKCNSKVTQYMAHESIVTIATTIMCNVFIADWSYKYPTDGTYYICVMQSYQLSLLLGVVLKKFLEFLQYLQRQVTQCIQLPFILALEVKTTFYDRSTRCVHLHMDTGQQSPLTFSPPTFNILIFSRQKYLENILA